MPPPAEAPRVDPARTMPGALPDTSAWDQENTGPLEQRKASGATPPSGAGQVSKAPPVARKFSSTIDPSRQPGAGAAGLRLVRLPREGEEEKMIEIPGDNVVLDRDNADPGNMSISSKGQAALEFADGNWYITDRSALHTTYIRVNERTKLASGDVILLGDRAFRIE